ncbi:hypothetical protein EMIHUDRAFT_464287 [Emiliania huxleyi CCMP1516]|uniref:Uncharacterized protein n=2 Tax=Emiliania huxleyi TaxID=2903 RepID=A0A0D3J033_EMIH1|nr:hypothetical protein EMIHUDRAFT_464287 [Emiliania huxleyi CCMP1516]EOD16868.1 hypothetical protein EMIHUDRAFT_464287 [Emiliania huxleyi CCMP1516]|eukprot:XP_005769297.1 hypothetical protein EMIHUDRAFT_464287 [Emiliania huxleyi CCMP1516]
MQSVPTVEPGEPMLRASRGSRALRIAPMLALLVGAGLFFSRPAEPPPSDIKLAIGKPFVQGIISLFDMKVDNILLQKPESQWSHFAVGMLAFDLLIDIHMARGCPAPRPAYHSRLCVRRDVATAYPGPVVHEDEFTVELFSVVTERPAAESLGVKFAEVNTEAGFSLGKGESEWFAVQGFLSVPEREYDLVKTADVLNHFLTSRPTPLIASIAGSSQPFFSAAAKGTSAPPTEGREDDGSRGGVSLPQLTLEQATRGSQTTSEGEGGGGSGSEWE